MPFLSPSHCPPWYPVSCHAHRALHTGDARRRPLAPLLRGRPRLAADRAAGEHVQKAAWLAIAPGQELHLVEVPDFEPSAFEEEFGRHIALSHPAQDFEGLRERLTRSGAEIIAPQRETPFRRFFFRSPDGYVFEVIES
jgi:catechol 2,3-dioxygenase-like lactoylglutathione lyase family enzyme